MNIPLAPGVAVGVAYGLNVLLMVTAIAGGTLLAARSMLRHDASARYVLCLTALVCILFAPLVIGAMGKKRFGLVVYALPAMAAQQMAPTVVPAALSGPPTTDLLPAREPAGWGIKLLVSIWAVGAAWGAARFVCGWRTVVRLRQSVHPLDVGSFSDVLEQVQRTLGAVVPPIFTSDRVVTPVAVGLWHPMVMLPQGLAEALTPAQLRHVLLHECAHVAGRHAFGGVMQRLVGLLFWPHPLVAALCRELARTREEVCDDVAAQEDGAACYARTLLTIAQGLSAAPEYASALALLGTETSLEQRISGLLDPRRNRMVGVKRWKLWVVTGGVTLTMAFAAAVRVVADDAQTQDEARQQGAAQAQRAQQAAQAQVVQAEAQMLQLMARSRALQAELAARKLDLQAQQFQAKTEVERAQHAAAQARAAQMAAQAQRAAAQARFQQAQAELMAAQAALVRTRLEVNQRTLELLRAQKGVHAPGKGTKAKSHVQSAQYKTSNNTTTGTASGNTSSGSSSTSSTSSTDTTTGSSSTGSTSTGSSSTGSTSTGSGSSGGR